jgi:1-acyl-sn-glycerol-3-phosphate acyltransferase
MGDAEIIPIGTRGKPGRGTGESRPSANSRSLAAKTTAQTTGKNTSKTTGRTPDQPAPEPPTQKTAQKTTQKTSQKTGAQRRAQHDAELPQQAVDAAVHDVAEATESAAPAAATATGGDRPRAVPEPTEPTEPTPSEPTPSETTRPSEPTPASADQPTVLPTRSPVTTDHRHPTPGIPPVAWLAALTSASKELFGENWEPRLAQFLAFLRRRLTGDYTVDDYGFDEEITEQFLLAAIRPIARTWFRVEVRGAENIPADGGALVVSNHSGTVPIDGMVTAASIRDHTGRFLRPLGADLVFRLPLIGDLARKGGATLACNEDAERMLRGGELVGVWPEGFKGIGKPFSERYKLQRFGRGGFVSAAIRTGVPIIPTSVVGAEEIYPLVGNIPSLARLLGIPYLPITPLFPLLGPLGLIPLPSKWLIEFGEPIRTDEYDVGAADDPMLVFNVTDQVRESIQQTLYALLMRRKSVFS